MQLVLNYQIGRIERPIIVKLMTLLGLGRSIEANVLLESIDMAKECSGLTDPRQARKLVDSRNKKGRQTPIDWFVDGQYRQRPAADEIASRVDAANLHVGRRKIVR